MERTAVRAMMRLVHWNPIFWKERAWCWMLASALRDFR